MAEPDRRTLAGRYELLSLIATGGMGQVWRARDGLLGRSVAVKVLRSEYTGDSTFLARFRAEAQHTARLVHRNIAALYDYGEVPAADAGGEVLAYLVMELVEGEPLSALLARDGRLDVARTLDILGQTAAALAAAHAAGVVHRDVKPGNVLVGNDGVVKITDFGIAWSASSVPLTRTGQVIGTAHYLAPEQAAGAKAAPASDVYALGMVGYECLAGRRAFEGDSPVQIALRQLRDVPDPLPTDVPANVRTLIDRALLKDPAERFPDGAAFAAAVADVVAGRELPPVEPAPTALFPGPLAGPAAAPSLRRRLLVPVVTLLTGAAIGVGALQFVGGDATAPPAAAEETPSAGASEQAAGPTDDDAVLLHAEDYVGRLVDDVAADLEALGLRVERAPQESSEVPGGQVTAVGPVGEVRPDTLVTVTYAVEPAPVPAPVPAPEPAPVPPAPAPAPQPPAAEPGGNGNGNAGGNGGGNGNGNGNAGGNGGGNGNGNGNGRGRAG